MLGVKLSDRYELLSEIGRGGMGVVYKAHDPALDREVAVKLIAPALLTPESEQRFRSEAQIVAQMDHPSIVSIHDFGRHEGSMFFVMPIVEGKNLRDALRAGSLSLGSILDVGIEVSRALEYSHARGVVHRDIKPENLMVGIEESGAVRVRVMDFGLARGATVSGLTKTGMLMGTMSYISPEQVIGQDVDQRSDIYSLGCVLYECLVSQVPFAGEMQAVLYRIRHERPQPPRELGADIDAELERVILSCLAKKSADRPQSAGDLAKALESYRTRLAGSERLHSIIATQTMQAPRPVAAPFVGREQEFAELQQRLNAAVAGECQFVAVTGEPGVGKSRLLDELGKLAAAREIRVLHGRFAGESGVFPYHGFCEAIQEYFRQKETDRTSSGLVDLSELAADLIELFPMLSEIEAVRSAAGGSAQVAPEEAVKLPENRTQVFELLARTLTLLAGGRPLVLLLEDLHSADASIEALQYILRRLGPTPTLIATSYRPGELDRHHPLSRMLEGLEGDRRFLALSLPQLSAAEHLELLRTLTGGTEISQQLAERLYEATEGNPFFAKEIVRSLLDSGSIQQDETGAWNLAGGAQISSDALPATIQQAVEQRIGDLPEELRQVLTIASVMGKTFEFEDLEELVSGREDLDDAVDRFVAEGLLEEDRQSRGDRLTFPSAVVREVLYGELTRRKRRSLHRKYADLLEKRYGGRPERAYPQLVHHFSEGDVPGKTVDYALAHAARSLEAFSPEEAARSAKTALEFLDEEWDGEPALEGEARLLLAKAHRMSGNVSGALREATAASTIFERLGEEKREAETFLFAAEAAWQSGLAEEARSRVERGMRIARSAGDPEILAQHLSLAATLANLRGEYERGAEYQREAARLVEETKAAEEQEEIPSGGTLVVGLANTVAATVPAELQLLEEWEVLGNVFETLIRTDREGNLAPHLCEKWELLDDLKGVRLTLRKGVRFEGGESLTAEAVSDSFHQAVRQVTSDLPAGFAALSGLTDYLEGRSPEIAGLRVVASDTVEFHLDEKLSVYPAMLADTRTAIVKAGEGGQIEGTGPFRLASRDDERVILERSPDYWSGEPAKLDSIEFRFGMKTAEIASGFRAGEIDLARDLLPEDLESFLRDPRYRRGLVEAPQKITYFVLFNSLDGPRTSSVKVREALSGVVRPRDIVWRSLGRFAEPATGLIPPGVLGHDPGRRLKTLALDEARTLLGAAAGEEPLRLRAAIHPLIRDRYGALVDSLFGLWAELGVEVETVDREMAAFLELFHDSEGLDLIVTRWMLDYDDPDNFTHSFFHSASGIFKSYFSSPETDELLEAARTERRPEARQAFYKDFETRLLEADIVVPLFHDMGYRLASPRLRGVRLGTVPPYVNYEELGKVKTAAPVVRTERGGTIRIPMAARVMDLDCYRMPNYEDSMVRPNIFEPLMRSVEGRVEPALAEECIAEQGARRFRFRLRPDVRFHDGRRLTSRDVRYSMETILRRTASESTWLYLPILGVRELQEGGAEELEGFRIHSDRDFTIELEERVSFFPVLLATDIIAIAPEGSERFGPSWRDGTVGTGPFRVTAFEPGQRLVLERHPGYWRRGLPRAEGLDYSFGVPPSEIFSGFREGRFSLAADLYPDDVARLRRDADYGRRYYETLALTSYFAVCNIHRGPLADAALRRRILDSIDASGIVERTLRGVAQPAGGLIPSGLLGHQSRVARPAPTSPSRVSPATIRLRAAIHPVFQGEYSAFINELKSALGTLGIEFASVTETNVEFLEATQTGDADFFVGRWGADYPDADSFVFMLNSREGFLGRLCGGKELDRLIADGRVEPDPAARHTIYRRIEEKLAREAILLPLFFEKVYRFARPEVEGLELTYAHPNVHYENLHIRQD